MGFGQKAKVQGRRLDLRDGHDLGSRTDASPPSRSSLAAPASMFIGLALLAQ
jgi:hypothetical protein